MSWQVGHRCGGWSYGLLSLVALCGCSGRPGRLAPPEVKPAESAQAALVALDKNQDQRISREECAASPPLLAAFERYDKNPTDKQLTADEIAARLQAMLDTRLGQMPCYCEVVLDGSPLVEANVRLVPDPMLGDALSVAEGQTDDRGVAQPQLLNAEPGTPGINFGLYRVEITHPQKKIPERYNTATTLGMEISPTERDTDHARFELKSKP